MVDAKPERMSEAEWETLTGVAMEQFRSTPKWITGSAIPTLVDESRRARGEETRLSELLWGSRCVYCGTTVGRDRQNQNIADEILRAHVAVCEKHPAFALRAESALLARELAEAKAKVMDLRRYRTEQDCRYTLGTVADIGGRHCPIEKPCERCKSEKLAEALRDVEWGSEGGCPSCLRYPDQGHAEACHVAAALAPTRSDAAGEEKKETK